eukprot:NODE_192_length_15450_cov_0.476355.p11 type:complete len:126 gc:universal NODE_192_length_15450_cov_0.476355:3784-3407(-)
MSQMLHMLALHQWKRIWKAKETQEMRNMLHSGGSRCKRKLEYTRYVLVTRVNIKSLAGKFVLYWMIPILKEREVSMDTLSNDHFIKSIKRVYSIDRFHLVTKNDPFSLSRRLRFIISLTQNWSCH